MNPSTSRLFLSAIVITVCLGSAGVAPATLITYTNLVPGNVSSITTDIPATWWQIGTTPSHIVDNDLVNRWLTGNYAPTWPSPPVSPPGPLGAQTLFPYHITLTFDNPVPVTRVREIYLQDGGGFSNVTITARDSSNNILGQVVNVPGTSPASWQAVFPTRLEGVKKLEFEINAHAMPSYHDVRLGEIQVFDDGGGRNLAPLATVTADFTPGTPLSAASNEDFGDLFYSSTWTPPGAGGTDGPRSITYDFGSNQRIGAFRVYYQASTSFLLKDYQIQVPDGFGGWIPVVTKTVPLSTKFYDEFTLSSPVTANKVRFYATDIYSSPDPRLRLIEFEILEAVPEPSVAFLLAVGALLISRRCRLH